MKQNDEPTTRDVIAIVAMHALLSRADTSVSPRFAHHLSEIAYAQADAFLKESEKK